MASYYVQDWVIARKLEDLSIECNDIQSLVAYVKFKSWRSNRKALIRFLRRITADLHSMQKHANRSKLSGGVMGFCGSLATIAGFALIPVTAGASLALSAGGAAVGAAGGVVSIVASLAEFGITKSLCDEATKMIKEDQKRTEDLKEHLQQLESLKKRLTDYGDEYLEELMSACMRLKDAWVGLKAAKAVKTDAGMVKKAMELNKLSKLFESTDFVLEAKNIKQLLQGSAKAITKAGKVTVVLGIISIPLDIWSIITESEKIKEGSKSEAAEVLEIIANTLEDEFLMCISDLKNRCPQNAL